MINFYRFLSLSLSLKTGKDSIYTSKQQIERLLRPGSSYANLNPFDVLLVDFEDDVDRIKKQYKRLSILLHPDKNTAEDQDRATKAFGKFKFLIFQFLIFQFLIFQF